MKKSYTKPIITFESLAVTPRIASGCALISTNNADTACPLVNEEVGWILFTEEPTCMDVVDPDDLCYDIPMDGNNVFQS